MFTLIHTDIMASDIMAFLYHGEMYYSYAARLRSTDIIVTKQRIGAIAGLMFPVAAPFDASVILNFASLGQMCH
jgi:hypothetical protein